MFVWWKRKMKRGNKKKKEIRIERVIIHSSIFFSFVISLILNYTIFNILKNI